MSVPQSIKSFLDSKGVSYQHRTHRQEFTASRVAEAQHVSGRRLAKSVLVKADDVLIMAVIPANERLDLEKFAHLTGVMSARLARESEFASVFADCEVGAEPPFGAMYGVPVWFDASFESQPTLTFNAGTHTDTMEIRVEDFERVEQPQVANLVELH